MVKDAELKDGAKPMCNFTMRTNKSWKDHQGNYQNKGTFHRVVVFGKLAAVAADKLKKGVCVFVEGEINNTSKKNPDGSYTNYSGVVADTFRVIEPGKGDNVVSDAPAPVFEATEEIPF